ncbi:hypothetical protein H4R99_000807 [Coemansia sp. RSA 1722]|nr:hypothetical protein LPJ57_004054 [Coemansia sp. RSA 486]KAJ2236463.1 hypothetical protein IWW45_001765 [Coemansia sp. RSA 485]KAJ2605803.1 hypothetical protein H4R99_000807 [Coemansia sp. RSA 1722]KAJ2638307.1 hypothetical protein GGF40_001758 [Coemansia sp. RSA 1286]
MDSETVSARVDKIATRSRIVEWINSAPGQASDECSDNSDGENCSVTEVEYTEEELNYADVSDYDDGLDYDDEQDFADDLGIFDDENKVLVTIYRHNMHGTQIDRNINSEYFWSHDTNSWVTSSVRCEAYDAENQQCRSCGYSLGDVNNPLALWSMHWKNCHVDELDIEMGSCSCDISPRLVMYRRPPMVTDCGKYLVSGPFECCCGELYAHAGIFANHALKCEDALSFSKRQTALLLHLDSLDTGSDFSFCDRRKRRHLRARRTLLSYSGSSESTNDSSSSSSSSDGGNYGRRAAKRPRPVNLPPTITRPRHLSARASLEKSLEVMRERAARRAEAGAGSNAALDNKQN